MFESLLSLSGVRIENSLTLDDSNIHALNMDSCRIGGNVILSGAVTNFLRSRVTGVFEGLVSLIGVLIENNLIINGEFQSNVHSLLIDSCRIGGNVILSGAKCNGTVNVLACDIGNINIGGARFSKTVEMSGTRISGELRLGSQVHAAARWSDDAELILRGARAGVLQDRLESGEDVASDAWPRKLQITNFTYEHLGGSYGGGESDMQRRDVRWYSDWLNRDQSYSPQPYEHLARVLRDAGDPQKANAILYAGRERARKEARKSRQFCRWSGLTILSLTMGYGLGYRYFRVVWWLITITLVGTMVLAKSIPADNLALPSWLTSAGQGPRTILFRRHVAKVVKILVLRAKYVWLCAGLVSRCWTCGVNAEKLSCRVLLAALRAIADAVGIRKPTLKATCGQSPAYIPVAAGVTQ